MTTPRIAVLSFAAMLGAAFCPARLDAQAAKPPMDTTHKMDKMSKMEMEHHGGESSGWKELDAFHTLLAETWHPVAKSKDLTPIREKAVALSDAAQAWSLSKAPHGCDAKPILDAVASVASESKALAQLVAKKAADAEVTSALKALHDRFETVEQGCKPMKH
ncbi:MAG: hypothetical protein V4550_21255 [Gemmatimonadota bacterium]